MAEILGAVAAAAQLTAICLALIELTERIKSRTSTLENYQKQLLQMQYISESILSNPLLQTPEIESHTRHIISLLSEHSLEPSFKRHRVSQIILFFSQDRTISRLFIDLERQKANLSLIINEVQSRALHQIQNNISIMSDRQGPEKRRSGRGKRAVTDDVESRPRSRQPLALEIPSSPDPLHHGVVVPYRLQPEIESPSGRGQGEPSVAADEFDITSQPSFVRGTPNPDPSWSKFKQLDFAAASIDLAWRDERRGIKQPKAGFYGCGAHGKGSVVNGTRIETKSKITPKQAAGIIDKETRYVACAAQNGGSVVNGTEIWSTEDTEPETFEGAYGQYFGCRLQSDEEDEDTSVTNGVSYRTKGSKKRASGSKKQRK